MGCARVHCGLSDVQGLAQLVGMTKLEGPQTIAEQFERYLRIRQLRLLLHSLQIHRHVRRGRQFRREEERIEDFDAALPILLRKKPDVLAITATLDTLRDEGHSWHPEPVMLLSACSGSDKLQRFTETGANSGSLESSSEVSDPPEQANAKMFDKFGA